MKKWVNSNVFKGMIQVLTVSFVDRTGGIKTSGSDIVSKLGVTNTRRTDGVDREVGRVKTLFTLVEFHTSKCG